MIGKPEWFQRRKHSGWGFTPRTWQGWAYIAVVAAPIFAIQLIPIPDTWKTPAMLVWAAIFAADFIHIMISIKNDERERQHEATAERNAAWTMIVIICIGIAYQAARQAKGGQDIDYFLIAVLAGGLAAKLITNVYLDRHA